MAKKRKKSKGAKRGYAQGATPAANGEGTGLFAGLSRLLPSRRSEQFLLGALVGAAAAYVLSDEELRGKLMRSGLKLYGNMAGGLAEMKEQMADIQAELATEPDLQG